MQFWRQATKLIRLRLQFFRLRSQNLCSNIARVPVLLKLFLSSRTIVGESDLLLAGIKVWARIRPQKKIGSVLEVATYPIFGKFQNYRVPVEVIVTT
jgi:hypothetical protein